MSISLMTSQNFYASKINKKDFPVDLHQMTKSFLSFYKDNF